MVTSACNLSASEVEAGGLRLYIVCLGVAGAPQKQSSKNNYLLLHEEADVHHLMRVQR